MSIEIGLQPIYYGILNVRLFGKRQLKVRVTLAYNPPVRLPQPSSSKKRDSDDLLDDDEATLLKLQKEGGVRFILYLVNKAIPRHDNDLPSELNVQNWTFRDILHLPAAKQKQWKDACYKELESLRKRNIYKLVQLPPGRKAIKNRWVFAIKSDGRKRA